MSYAALLSTAFFAALLPLCVPSAHAGEETYSTAQEQWKHDVIDKYDEAVYFDEHDQKISEQAFMRALREERRSLSIETRNGSMKLITLRLLPAVTAAVIDPVFTPSPTITKRGLAGWKHDMVDPYGKAVYLDELGREIPVQAFMDTTLREHRSIAMHADRPDKTSITLRLLPQGATARPAVYPR